MHINDGGTVLKDIQLKQKIIAQKLRTGEKLTDDELALYVMMNNSKPDRRSPDEKTRH